MKHTIQLWTLFFFLLFPLAYSVQARVPSLPFDDHAALAQRFRPYYKYSVEPLHGQEQVRPISWQSFVRSSELWLGAARFMTRDQLQGDGTQILGVVNSLSGGTVQSDLRKSALKTHPFSLHIAESARRATLGTRSLTTGPGSMPR